MILCNILDITRWRNVTHHGTACQDTTYINPEITWQAWEYLLGSTKVSDALKVKVTRVCQLYNCMTRRIQPQFSQIQAYTLHNRRLHSRIPATYDDNHCNTSVHFHMRLHEQRSIYNLFFLQVILFFIYTLVLSFNPCNFLYHLNPCNTLNP
jgi:hypothetical protein